ncbi:MAG: flagellar biosynthesis protein FlhB [Planctomycetaceae bacterium]
MADDLGQPRTEAATPRRRQEAREQGQIALSHDLSAAIVLLTCLAAFWWAGRGIALQLLGAVRNALHEPASADWGVGQTLITVHWLTGQLAATTGLIVGAIFVVLLIVGLAQAGFTVSFKPLETNWERLSPVNGWTRLLSWDGAVRGISALFKVSVVATVLVWYLGDRVQLLRILGQKSLGRGIAAGWQLTLETAFVIAGGFFVIGASDYLYQWFRNEQKLKMTREEVKQEHREDDGDPHVKARIRRLQREAAEKKMIQDVPKATVVVTNPTHFAVAIRYDRYTMAAPMVIAKGSDRFARRIADVARQHGIPVLERKPLARLLYRSVKIGQTIPQELYQALAEILAYVYRLKRA